jgi:hypothetical protein
MPFYNYDPYNSTLKWDDVFTSATEFIAKMVSVGGITDTADLTELYEILSLKYVLSTTRYTDDFAFMQAIKRELYTEFPFYLKKKELADEMIAIEIDEIQRGQRQLQNTVDTHDEPIVNADTVPFDDLSTQQTNIEITNNKLEAIKQKYNVMNRNYLQGIYKRCDELFAVVLSRSNKPLYPQGDES